MPCVVDEDREEFTYYLPRDVEAVLHIELAVKIAVLSSNLIVIRVIWWWRSLTAKVPLKYRSDFL